MRPSTGSSWNGAADRAGVLPARVRWSRLFPAVAVLLAWLGQACSPQPVPGRYQCRPDEPGTCPSGWVCRQTSAEDRVYRCFPNQIPICGNGIVEMDEECDGLDFAGLTCRDEGFAGGTLRCSEDCHLNVAGCVPALCGNGVAETPEACDTMDMGGSSCSDVGLTGGPVSCYRNCTADFAACDPLPSCGNGILETGEQCEPGQDVGSCDRIGFPGGRLGCNDNCTLDTSGCTLSVCGNGLAEADVGMVEDCDGDDLRQASCADLGYPGGDLACLQDCTYDTSGCLVPDSCGNGVREGLEQCDGEDFSGMTCRSLGFSGGTLRCTQACGYDTSACEEEGPRCGNGVLEEGEECDGRQSVIQSCLELGFSGGALSCDCTCELDTSRCTCPEGTLHQENGCVVGPPPETCGDGIVQPGEQCDGDDLAGQTCQSMGLAPGMLACNGSCGFDLSGCGQPTSCGNGVRDFGEECDGSDFGGQSCQDFGFDGGTLACLADCRMDTSGCTNAEALCGNGVVESGEMCDGNDLDGKTCLSEFGRDGSLGCFDNCTLDTSGCGSLVTCGNGLIESGELCDGTNLGGMSCLALDMGTGHLFCLPNCTFDTGGCAGSLSCGNGMAQGSEECDGDDLRGQDCSTIGYEGPGHASCLPNCTIDWGACSPPQGACNHNGRRDGSEMCDGDDLGGLTCRSLGLGVGVLVCNDNCTLDKSNCQGVSVCRNGIREAGEQCEPGDLNGQTCESLGLGDGSLGCYPESCLFDVSDCGPPAGCGDGQVQGGEECEPSVQPSIPCNTLGFDWQSATCLDNCRWDRSTCEIGANCGNGVWDVDEPCDPFSFEQPDCSQFGFPPGPAGCTPFCEIDVSACGSSGYCGNGHWDPGEDCDGSDFNGQTCASLGLGEGDLECYSDCTFATLNCTGACGNGIREGAEECDGDDLSMTSCGQFANRGSGELSCLPNCLLDASACETVVTCGNGVVDSVDEQCDGADLRGMSCVMLGRGTGLLSCLPNCLYDLSGCTGSTICGDNRTEGREECDGEDLGGATCADIGYESGQVFCFPNCTIEWGNCSPPDGLCNGNGQIDPGEQCDGPDLAGQTCRSLGLGVGMLACNGNCTFDTSGCQGVVICGNGNREGGEECDDSDLGGVTCEMLGLGSGQLSCLDTCMFDTTQCGAPIWCGNGVVDGSEECEPEVGPPIDCQWLGFDQGQASCSNNCSWDRSTCSIRSNCGNGVIDSDETCDGTVVPDCSTAGWGSGPAVCTPFCEVDWTVCDGYHECGNGIREDGEDCDQMDLGGANCASATGDASPYGDLYCDWDCVFDVSSCWGDGTQCGNGIVETGEDCDGTDLNGADCGGETADASPYGQLACDPYTCLYDLSGCSDQPICGNGILETGEDCDGSNLGGTDCSIATGGNYPYGELACDPSTCTFDTTGCTEGRIVTVSAGDTHTCAVRDDGALWCWGANGSGQLGDGTQTARLYPVRVYGFPQTVSFVRVKTAFSCATIADGRLYCWGDNLSGQLGDGTQEARSSPTEVSGISGVTQFCTGASHVCAVDGDGTLMCWGNNDYGQLGLGGSGPPATSPQPVGLSGTVVWLACGQAHTCAGTDMDTYCWGDDSQGQLGNGQSGSSASPGLVSGLGPMAIGGSGAQTTCASDGSTMFECWGDNDYGAVGDGTTEDATEPRMNLMQNPVRSVDGGTKHTCAVTQGVLLYCWGYNGYGQLGTGDTTDATSPIMVPGFAEIWEASAGSYHTCAVDGNGDLWCWGHNSDGQLGQGYTSATEATPLQVEIP